MPNTQFFFQASPGLLVGLIVPIVLWAVLLVIAKRVPPVVKLPGMPSSVGGLLSLLLFCLAFEAAWSLWIFGRALGEVIRVAMMDAQFIWPAVKTLIPSLFASFAGVGVLVLLAVGRSPAALWTAVALLWFTGPVNDWLESVILGVPFAPDQAFAGVSIFTIVATVYLLFSRRPAFTYGTRSAKRIAAQYAAMVRDAVKDGAKNSTKDAR